MIRLLLKRPDECAQILFFDENSVSIGRAPDNEICLEDRSVSKFHGRIYATRVGYVYEDLNSTNGSVVLHDQERIPLTGRGTKALALTPGDVVQIAGHSIRLEGATPAVVEPADRGDVTVMLAHPCGSPAALQDEPLTAEDRAATFVLHLVRETSLQLKDERRLYAAVGDILLRAFPPATHVAMAARDGDGLDLRPLLSRSRAGELTELPLSRTIVERVLRERVALLFTRGQGSLSAAQSIVAAHIEQAMCAPLSAPAGPFAVICLDIRAAGRGAFGPQDLDLLSLLAGHLGLVLDNRRLYQEQQRALNSTINALVRSLSLKDPETAAHSERVRSIALLLGREIGLSDEELEVLGVASVLHDTGKHASRIELLYKPAPLTPAERREMNEHAHYTQSVLDMIHYPEHLRDVPRVAACHHEKMDGSGTFGLRGEEIPQPARILAVADVLDALVTPRPYKPAKSFAEALTILAADRDRLWDGRILDVAERITPEIARSVYRMDSFILRSPREEDAAGAAEAA